MFLKLWILYFGHKRSIGGIPTQMKEILLSTKTRTEFSFKFGGKWIVMFYTTERKMSKGKYFVVFMTMSITTMYKIKVILSS